MEEHQCYIKFWSVKRIGSSLFTTFLFPLFLFAQGSNPEWVRDYAWGGDSLDVLMDLIETEDRLSTLSGGHTLSNQGGEVIRQGFGEYDFWIIEEDTIGNYLWNAIYGGDSTDLFSKIVELDDGYLLTGSSASPVSGNKTTGTNGGFDYWVIKVDEKGQVVWDKNYGGNQDDFLLTAHLLENGNVILGGSSASNASGDKSQDSYGKTDYWLVVIDPEGNLVWEVTLGGEDVEVMTSLNVENGIFIGGYSNSDVSGVKSTNSYGGYDYWMLKLNEITGAVEWDFTYGGAGDDYLVEVINHDHSSDVYVTGTSNSGATGVKNTLNEGANDFWVLQVDSKGELNWELNLGGTGNDLMTAAIQSPEGSIIVGGYSNSDVSGNKTTSNNGGYDYWIAKIDSTGTVYWEKNYGGAQDDTLQAIHMRCDRGLYLGGHSASGVSGDRTYANRGYQDYWAIYLDVPTIPKMKVNDHCFGMVMHFFDDSEIWPEEWSWDFGDPNSGSNSSSEQHPLHQFSAPGLYEISLTVKEGCQNDTMVTQSINVWENKILGKADLEAPKTICIGQQLELKNNKRINLPDDVTYLWGGGETTPEIIIDSAGVYSLTLTSDNCTATDSVVVAPCPIIHVPNAFSPNEDGINDQWGFVGVGIVEFEMFIFDRWGLLLFESQSIDDWWDGTYKGRVVQQDVYVYKATYQGVASNAESVTGTVTLLR